MLQCPKMSHKASKLPSKTGKSSKICNTIKSATTFRCCAAPMQAFKFWLTSWVQNSTSLSWPVSTPNDRISLIPNRDMQRPSRTNNTLLGSSHSRTNKHQMRSLKERTKALTPSFIWPSTLTYNCGNYVLNILSGEVRFFAERLEEEILTTNLKQ